MVGAKKFLGPATNCHELGLLGYTLNGYYLVKKKNSSSNKASKIAIAYCRFQQTEGEYQIFKELLGNVDVKMKSVHFHVQRNNTFSASNSVVSFELARLNEGGAMNLASGIFTAPVAGIYQFEFSGVKDPNAPFDYLDIFLQVNGVNVGFAYTDDTRSTKSTFGVSLTASLRLNAEDRVNLFNRNKGMLYDSRDHFTHFSGWLVEEDLFI